MRTLLTGLLLLAASAVLPGCDLEAQRVPEGAAFVASSRGQVYYPVTCPAWRDLARANLRFFDSEAAAEEAGYRPTRARACLGPGAGTLDLPAEALGPDVLGPGGAPAAGGASRGPGVRVAPPGGERARRIAGGCIVERVVDGDTVHCRAGARIRLLLIDAPETGQGSRGLEARLALEEVLAPGDTAAVELDVQERDRYGRILGHLHARGVWVNRAVVRRGYAVPLTYPPNVRWVEEIRAAADSARAEARGLWARDAFACLPVDFRAGRCR